MSPSSSEAVLAASRPADAAGPVPRWRAALDTAWVRSRNQLRTSVKPAAVYVDAGDAGGDAQERAHAAVAAFSAWCAQHAGSRCELGLSARLVHACAAPAEAGAMPAADLRDYAQRQFDFYFGAAEGDAYAVAVSTDARASLACGASQRLVAGLQAAAAAHGVCVLRLAPWWARGVQAALAHIAQQAPVEQAACVVAAVEDRIATLVLAQGERIQRLWAEPLHGEPDAATFAQWRERIGQPAALWLLRLPADARQQAPLLLGKLDGSVLQKA